MDDLFNQIGEIMADLASNPYPPEVQEAKLTEARAILDKAEAKA